MKKILTISVAAYNVEKYIRQTLDSLVVPEILDKLEVFVVDDGSTDNTLAIAQEYESKYPNTFHAVHKKNGGYGSTINYSVAHATGKYFKQLDGDDWFQTKSLTDYIKLLEDIDTDLVFTQIVKYYEKTEKTQIKDLCENMDAGKHLFMDAHFEQFITMHASTIKTKVLKDMKYKLTEHCFYTDNELVYFPLSIVKDIYVYHMPIYVYRLGRDGQSVSIEGYRKYYKDYEKVFWNIVKVYKEIPDFEKFKKDCILSYIISMISGNFKHYSVLKSKKEIYSGLSAFSLKLNNELPGVLNKAAKNSKLIRLMLITNYRIYPLYAQYFMIKRKIMKY